MAKLGNVVILNHNEGSKNVFESIHTFLLRKGQNSKNTMITYERAIRDFFNTMRNKDVEKLTVKDVIFEKKQIKAYQVKLKEKYKGATVNNAITALKQCYGVLEDDGFPVSASWFNLERYDEHDKESYDAMAHHEIINAINLVSNTRAGNQKSLLLRLAYSTAFRKESLLNLEWKDIINKDETWFVKTLGKGNKWDYKKISNDLYSELMKHKETSNGDKIFTLTHKTVSKMMNFIRENMDFGERNITFHSLKKSSIQEVALLTNYDLKAMQAQGNHSNVTTTLNDYMAKKKLDDLIIVDINYHVPVEKFEEMSKEELINLIKNSDRSVQVKLLQKAGLL